MDARERLKDGIDAPVLAQGTEDAEHHIVRRNSVSGAKGLTKRELSRGARGVAFAEPDVFERRRVRRDVGRIDDVRRVCRDQTRRLEHAAHHRPLIVVGT